MRAFVIGNGASLNETPMNKLKNEFTIGMNRFDLLGLNWDPNWWVMADVRHQDGWWDWRDLLRRKSAFLFRERDRPIIEPYGRKNAVYIDRCVHHDYLGNHDEWVWHLPTLCTRGGGANISIQIAASLGYDPIYLVGCDLYKYRGPDDPDINHFDPDYCPYKTRKTGDEVNGPKEWDHLNQRLIKVHSMARDSAASMGLSVYNATVGGQLEVYERKDIHAVLNGKT